MTTTDLAPSRSAVGASATAAILVYSDNAAIRAQVRGAIGDSLGGRAVELTDVATSKQAMFLAEENHYDLVIMDNETTKCGGVGLTRQMRNELTNQQPLVLLLLARQQDAWLAAWSRADAAVVRPVDPFELRRIVAGLLHLEAD
ncbi:MAG: hypothetical protein LBR27_10955 [Bifidobacteriaceae bacterium]|nr:hypothetical protein [Bifidobacteriaceae bacterium]